MTGFMTFSGARPKTSGGDANELKTLARPAIDTSGREVPRLTDALAAQAR